MKLTVEELFEKENAMAWIGSLIGKTHTGCLENLMKQASDIRLGHTAATYLLGMAVRDRLQLPFDLLPRFINSGSCDGFQFFWALICLCHDLGYHFENSSKGNKDKANQMNTPEQRRVLFGVKYDLLALEEDEVQQICSVLGDKYCLWISDALQTIREYDRYRRKTIHDPEATTDRNTPWFPEETRGFFYWLRSFWM